MIEEDSTWKQMERRLKQEGYREGAAEGREATFQKGFDDGYTEGIKIGKLLGYDEGIARFKEYLEKGVRPATNIDAAKCSRRGACLLCTHSPSSNKVALPDAVYDRRYADIVAEQRSHNESLKPTLKDDTSKQCNTGQRTS